MQKKQEPLIMIVEDNPANLKLVQDLLQLKDFSIITATNAFDALNLLMRVHPDIILMDISLKGVEDGLSLTKLLKGNASTKDIPIIALTAHAMEQNKQDALNAGCDGFISKPINTRTFCSKLQDYITKSQKT